MVNFCAAQQTKNENSINYSVVNWNTDQGFPSKYTNCILKDKDGFLWIGTQTGLSRFDGSTFKNYFPGVGKNETIPGANIIGLKEDSLHDIWIGTDNGISRYDIKADTFTIFYPVISVDNTKTFIIPFWATKDEVFCMEADSIFTAYNIHSLKKRIIVKLPQKIEDNRIVPFSVYDAKTNSVWMQPASGYLSALSGLFNVSLLNGKKTLYDWPCFKNIPHHFHYTEGMCYDSKRNCLWLNNDDGLIQFTLSDRKFYYIDAVKDIHDRGVGISVDSKERIWVGTGDKGTFIYDPATNTATIPFSDNLILRDSVNWSNYRIYCDRDGFVWIGYWTQFGKGIMQLIPTSEAAHHYTLDIDRAYLKVKAFNGQLCIIGDKRINIFNPKTGTSILIKGNELKGLEKNNDFEFGGIDSTLKKAWLCINHPDRLYEMDMSSLVYRPMKIKDLSNKYFDSEVVMDDVQTKFYKNGFLFIGSSQKSAGVFAVNKDSVAANQLIAVGDKPISVIATDGDRTIFLRVDGAIDNLSYTLINNKWVQIHTPIDSIPWIGIYYNKTDETWWAGGAFMQLLHYDKNFHLIYRYTQSDGIQDIQIHSMIADNSGNIWFNGSSGYISQLNIKTGIITRLSEKDGFQKQPNYPQYNCLKDDNGDVYFTGYAGMDRIKPDKYTFTPASVYLKSIEVNQFNLPLSAGVNNIKDLHLKYFQNRINIETGTIDYYSQGKNHIRYKLQGRDKNWQYAPSNYTIRYEELPPEKYTLLMQAGNAGNEFIGPVKSLLITITPAFWNTWSFRIIAVILIASAFYLIMRRRLKQKFKLQLERSEKERQMSDLKQKATELEMQALRAQMNPHFIFNSLNSINRFILQNERAQASEYLTKFSKLVRLILQNSQSSLIPLDSELESLGLYLNLEALRFNYHFDYKISLPKDLDISALQVPPLILQPYVENAIWHGLMHKEEKGQLDIEVFEEDDHLYFKIKDNGIGREKAAALASKSATKHKSMGLRITANRIAIMQNTETMLSPVTFNDLINTDGSAAGTEVVIKMPVLYD